MNDIQRGYEVEPLGDSAFEIRWLTSQPQAALELNLGLQQWLSEFPITGLIAVVPAFESIGLHYDPLEVNSAALLQELQTRLQGLDRRPPTESRRRRIPVDFDSACGVDLPDVAARAGMTVDEVIARFTGAEYRVQMLGFAPGFPYLAGLPAELAMPRLATPRLEVPAGSVAIGGAQAGIYPNRSPGGWRLIGRTPLILFDPQRHPACWLAPGDRVEFVDISRAEANRSGEDGS